VVVNVASGSVGPDAPDEIARRLADFGVKAKVHACIPGELMDQLRASVDAAPDLLITLAGDGTVRAAAELAGPDGPMLAPLPGGTMNMLPNAVYGGRPWAEALEIALKEGRERDLGGGCIEGHRFLCAAILGSPARLAPAREAAREGEFRQAFQQVRKAVQRAFTGRLRYQLDAGARGKAEALVLICPIASKVMRAEEPELEAAALDIRGAGELLRLGMNTLVRDWREDPGVESVFCRKAKVWSAHRIPATLDGESVMLAPQTEVRFDPKVCRVLTPPKEDR
jgi:diacylglycerol kinase family enzyme